MFLHRYSILLCCREKVSPAIFERSFTNKIVQFSYNPDLFPREGKEADTSVENETLRPIVSLYSGILLEDPVIIHERIASADQVAVERIEIFIIRPPSVFLMRP